MRKNGKQQRGVRSSLWRTTSPSVPGSFQEGVSLRVEGNFMPWAVDEGSAFPAGGQTSASAGFVMFSRWPSQCRAADVCIFRQGRDFCVYCLLCTETYQFLNTKTSQCSRVSARWLRRAGGPLLWLVGICCDG